MRGFIFTEFVELVEHTYGNDLADQLLDSTPLESGGAYTEVDNYDHKEIVQLVSRLSSIVEVSVPDLLKVFGEKLFGYLARSHSQLMKDFDHPFELLLQLENHVHSEVRKLYPDAEVPFFDTERLEPDSVRLRYRSSRGMPDLAEGLIVGAFGHFNMTPSIRREDHSDGQGTDVSFFVGLVDS